jgi:hypothetical protein
MTLRGPMHLLRLRTARARRSKSGFSSKQVYRQRANTVERQNRWRQGAILLPPFFCGEEPRVSIRCFQLRGLPPIRKKTRMDGAPCFLLPPSSWRGHGEAALTHGRHARRAAPDRDSRLNGNGTAADADSNSVCRTLRQRVKRSCTCCRGARQTGIARLLERMTKVIPRRSDEGGGCRNALPE